MVSGRQTCIEYALMFAAGAKLVPYVDAALCHLPESSFLIFGASLYVLLRRIQRNWCVGETQ